MEFSDLIIRWSIIDVAHDMVNLVSLPCYAMPCYDRVSVNCIEIEFKCKDGAVHVLV